MANPWFGRYNVFAVGFGRIKVVEYMPFAIRILFVVDVILNLLFDNLVTVPVNGLVNVENVGVSL